MIEGIDLLRQQVKECGLVPGRSYTFNDSKYFYARRPSQQVHRRVLIWLEGSNLHMVVAPYHKQPDWFNINLAHPRSLDVLRARIRKCFAIKVVVTQDS